MCIEKRRIQGGRGGTSKAIDTPAILILFVLSAALAPSFKTQMQEGKRRESVAMLSTVAAAVCSLQLLCGIPTATASSQSNYGARRTLYYQDASCRLETFREFAYDAMSIETDGSSAQGMEWCFRD